MSDLSKIAEKANIDARRAQALRNTIQIVGDHSQPDMLRVTVEFVGHPRDYEAGEEVVKTIIRLWQAIWKETMEVSASELKQIEDRYASLMSEGSTNE